MQCHLNKSYLLTSLKYLTLTKCIIVLIYNYFAPKYYFARPSAKIRQYLCCSILSNRTLYGASVQLYHKALTLETVLLTSCMSNSPCMSDI